MPDRALPPQLTRSADQEQELSRSGAYFQASIPILCVIVKNDVPGFPQQQAMEDEIRVLEEKET